MTITSGGSSSTDNAATGQPRHRCRPGEAVEDCGIKVLIASSTLWNTRPGPNTLSTPKRFVASCARSDLSLRYRENNSLTLAMADEKFQHFGGSEINIENCT